MLISGSRVCATPSAVGERLDKLPKKDLIIVHGAAKGVDSVAQEWCLKNNVTVRPYPADWSRYGRAAGPKRNRQMLGENPDLIIAFPGPESKGTWDMIDAAEEVGHTVEIIHLGE